MTNRIDYTQEQWALLRELPRFLGYAIMFYGKEGEGTVKETYTLEQAYAIARQDYVGNELIQALVLSTEDLDVAPPDLSKDAGDEKIKQEVVAACTKANEILESVATESEAVDYRDWAYAVAASVAKSSKEGSFLGLGGTRLSESEQDLLGAIKTALGYEP